MKKVISVRKNDMNFDLHLSDNAPEFFADGFGQLMLGYPESKVILYTVQPAEEEVNAEQRKAVATLIMSTSTLIEMCQKILDLATAHSSTLLSATAIHQSKLSGLLSKGITPTAASTKKKTTSPKTSSKKSVGGKTTKGNSP